MSVAIDTCVLISAERLGDFDQLHPENEDGLYYIPAYSVAKRWPKIGTVLNVKICP